MLIGRVDELKNGAIFGWAFNSDQPSEHLVVRVMLGPQVIASGVANIMRRDLPDAGIGDGDHAFQIVAPPNVVSFEGLMIIAQSQKHGEVPLPIATTDDRRIDKLFGTFASQYEEALILFKGELDAVKAKFEALEIATESGGTAQPTQLPEDLAQRLLRMEARMDAAEVFFVRIDELVRKLVEEKASRRKRFLGIF